MSHIRGIRAIRAEARHVTNNIVQDSLSEPGVGGIITFNELSTLNAQVNAQSDDQYTSSTDKTIDG